MAGFLVSVSTGTMVSLLGKLGAMLTDEYKLLKDVRGDIKFLKDELDAMQVFLLMMTDVEEPDHQAKLRADAVRELSYDIEDQIDKFMILVDQERTSKSDSFNELFKKSMKKISKIKSRHKIAKDVKDIKSQIHESNKRYKRYNIKEPFNSRNQKVDPRLCAVYKDASELIGIDGPRDELVKWLSNKEGESTKWPKVVSIVGYGGLGKTTLAKQVYDKLGANFECRAFVSISRSPDTTKILNSILSQLRIQDYAHVGAGDPQLIVDRIRNFLKDKRQRLVHRWISEGFIHGKDGEDLVELGETCFHELVNKSLIQPVDIGYDGNAWCYQVDDTVLDFLISKSTEENFCTM